MKSSPGKGDRKLGFYRPYRGFWFSPDAYQGLHSLRSLTPGYRHTPLRG